jgi:hypothetical protein
MWRALVYCRRHGSVSRTMRNSQQRNRELNIVLSLIKCRSTHPSGWEIERVDQWCGGAERTCDDQNVASINSYPGWEPNHYYQSTSLVHPKNYTTLADDNPADNTSTLNIAVSNSATPTSVITGPTTTPLHHSRQHQLLLFPIFLLA